MSVSVFDSLFPSRSESLCLCLFVPIFFKYSIFVSVTVFMSQVCLLVCNIFELVYLLESESICLYLYLDHSAFYLSLWQLCSLFVKLIYLKACVALPI